MATLYELTDELRYLYDCCEDPEMDEESLIDAINEVSGQFEDKAEGYAKLIRQLKADAEAFRAEAERLTKRKQTCWNAVDRIQKTLEEAMKATGKTKFKTNLFSFSIQKNPPSVVIDHPELVPKEFIIPQKPVYDKMAIKEQLNSIDVDECAYAHIEQGEGLRIR